MGTVIEINSVSYGSTGNIARSIAKFGTTCNHSIQLFVPKGRHNRCVNDGYVSFFGNRLSEDFHIIASELTGLSGCFSYFATRNLLHRIDKMDVDIIHLHNLHKSYINLPLLFKYIRQKNISVVWTLHDCWAFTGHCPHFTIAKCDKWKHGCNNCLQYKLYPKSFVDNSEYMWKLKKKWFTGLDDLTIVTPSNWLADLVRQSYLGDYPVRVINNGIDLSVFKPTLSEFRSKYGIADKYVVLGVSFGWRFSKGLDIFVELANKLGDDYVVVIVGTDSKVDKELPDSIISIHRTVDQTELAKIYSTADVFVNPTREEVLGLVNIEALACGTPVITFPTGGCPECIDESCGIVLDHCDVDELYEAVVKTCTLKSFSLNDCVNKAKEFEYGSTINQYINLYEEVL